MLAIRCYDQPMSLQAGQLYAQSQIESGTLDFAGFEEDLAEVIED